jgi:hypothetical protein
MTRKEMLEKSGLTEDEFQDLVHKFQEFHRSLNKSQRDAIDRSLPTTAEAAATFGPGVTPELLGKLFGTGPGHSTATFQMHAGIWAKAE